MKLSLSTYAVLALTSTALATKYDGPAGHHGKPWKPSGPPKPGNPQQKPNIVMIMSDDQDRQLGSLDYMPTLQKELMGHGVEFENHFGTVSNCCPARASFLRGQAAHSTNITHVRPPG